MKYVNKKSLIDRVRSVLSDTEGASLVLVTIISIIIITGIVILRVTTSSLWATADKQLNQDRAYMMAVTMGDAIDKRISDGTITDLSTLNGFEDTDYIQAAIQNSSIKISTEETSSGYWIITINSQVADATYEYKLTYLKNGLTRQY